MMKFNLVDAGCLMYESAEARWIIEHPTSGYQPTESRMWDVILEHPVQPHSMPLKFLGSFKAKKTAIDFVVQKHSSSVTYFNAIAQTNDFYNEDYTKK